MYLKYFAIAFLLEFIDSFNLDTDFPYVFMDPVAERTKFNTSKSYFGYSVVIYPGNMMTHQGEWIKIGAPKAKDTTKSRIIETGLVYNCRLMEGCTPVNLPISRDWKGSYIGGTMDISYKFDRMAICGYRKIERHVNEFRMKGACFWSSLNTSIYENISPILPANEITEYFGQSVYYTGQGQAGFSVHFPQSEYSEMILGAPGVFNWAGTPFRVSDIANFIPDVNRRRRYTDIDPFKKVELPDAKFNKPYDLSGYAVTSGNFYKENKLYYVASAPRGNQYTGKVVIFQFDQSRAIDQKETIVGLQFGEYFGASLAAGKINGDQFDDLIVGAPFHKGSTFNEGRVYVFLGAGEKLKESTVLEGSNKNGQFGTAVMFLGDIDHDGFGDVAVGAPYENEESGVVYIYKGQKYGLSNIHSQKIIGKDIYPSIKGFGISISRAIDIDKNKFKDLAIGAHVSGNAVLLRGRPIVVIKYTFSSLPSTLKQDSDSFLLNVCFEYSKFEEQTQAISYNITVDKALGRATIGRHNKTLSKILTIRRGEQTCDNVTISLKASSQLDHPITASLSYGLNETLAQKAVIYISDTVNNTNDRLCLRCPILDRYRSNNTYYEIAIPFTLDCGEDNDCRSKLTVNVHYPDFSDGESFIIGSSHYLKQVAIVKNEGENAYSAGLEVTFPDTVVLRQIPPLCSSVNSLTISCFVGDPLRENEMKQFIFDLDVQNIDNDQSLSSYSIPFVYKFITTSNNTNKDSNTHWLKVGKEADMTIYGTSEQKSNSFGNTASGFVQFKHIYKVEKIGVSPLGRATVKIMIPHAYTTPDTTTIPFIQLFEPKAKLGNRPVMCHSDFTYISDEKGQLEGIEESANRRKRQVEVFGNISKTSRREDIKINDKDIAIVSNKTFWLNCITKDVHCLELSCVFGPFDKQQLAVIKIEMMLNVSALAEPVGDNETVLLSTQGSVEIDLPKDFIQNGNRPDSVTISSVFVNDKQKKIPIALWIIILAAIIGFLLLFLLIVTLMKVGFFQRSKKKELQDLIAAAELESDVQVRTVNDPSEEPQEELQQPLDSTMNSSLEGLCDESDEEQTNSEKH